MEPEATQPGTALAAAVKVITRLHAAGYVAYLAGGCVRDAMLGLAPKDFDVATSAHPDAVLKLFSKAWYVGEAFGVVLVRMDHRAIEVATFRREWGYDDGRRPGGVEFTDARHDAARRDFTVNGLFADPLPQPQEQLEPANVTERGDASLPDTARPMGRVIDFVGGRADLRAKVLRAIGNPDERFAEDYLRMLRAVRFAARLEFELEQATARAILVHAGRLSQISRERIGMELMPMLSSPVPARRARAASLIQSLHLDGPTLNEERCERAPATLAALSADADYPTALTAWMLDRHLPAYWPTLGRGAAGDGELADAVEGFVRARGEALTNRWRQALVLSNDHRGALSGTLTLLPGLLRWRQLPLSGKKRLLARDRSAQATMLLEALAAAAPDLSRFEAVLGAIRAETPALRAGGVAPEPLVTGDELIRRGLRPSRRFKELLDHFYDLQLEGTLRDASDVDRVWATLPESRPS